MRTSFTELHWGVPVKPEEDLGEDLLAFAHDEELGDLGLPVAVQVKSSETKYSVPDDGPDGEPGWWYYEADTDHFDHWVVYGLPYLLVLHDYASNTSYWAHVTGTRIQPSGKGRRIFVPAAQSLDEGHKDALLEVAKSNRVNQLEGSAWDGHIAKIAESDRLRAALITPRLVAPHPNRGMRDVRFEEAVATLLLGRFGALDDLARKGHCPKLEEWRGHKDWGWRFAGTLVSLIQGGDTAASLVALADEARHSFERAACLVVAACDAMAGPHPLRAFEWLDHFVESATADERKEQGAKPAAEPATVAKGAALLGDGPDLGWALAHRAHLLGERGDMAAASETAGRALVALRHRPDDAAAAALRGGCAAVMMSAAASEAAVKAAIVEQDTAVAWWRSQRLGTALGRDVDDRFRVWSARNGVRFGQVKPAEELDLLRWNAALSASWGSWRHLSGIAGRVALMGAEDDDALVKGLLLLRQAGDRDAVRDAARTLWRTGRYPALASATAAFVEAEWLGRTEGPTLCLLAETSDLMPDSAADRTIGIVTALIEDDGEMRRFPGGTQRRWGEVMAATRRLAEAATPDAQIWLARWYTAHLTAAAESDGDSNGLQARDLIGAIVALMQNSSVGVNETLGANGTFAQLLELANQMSGLKRWELIRGLTFVYSPAAELLAEHADAGDEDAIRVRLTLGSHSQEDWTAVAALRRQQVRKIVDDARGSAGSSSFIPHLEDRVHDLTLAAYHLNDNDSWAVVCDALESGVLMANQVAASVGFIAHHFAELPESVQGRVCELAPTLNPRQMPLNAIDFGPLKLALEISSGTISADAAVARILSLQQQGQAREACELLTLWAHPMAAGILVATCGHPDARTRAELVKVDEASGC